MGRNGDHRSGWLARPAWNVHCPGGARSKWLLQLRLHRDSTSVAVRQEVGDTFSLTNCFFLLAACKERLAARPCWSQTSDSQTIAWSPSKHLKQIFHDELLYFCLLTCCCVCWMPYNKKDDSERSPYGFHCFWHKNGWFRVVSSSSQGELLSSFCQKYGFATKMLTSVQHRFPLNPRGWFFARIPAFAFRTIINFEISIKFVFWCFRGRPSLSF